MSKSGMFSGSRKWQGEEHNWVQQHSLGLTLAALLIAQTAHALWSGHRVWGGEAQMEAKILGEKLPDPSAWGWDFWVWWGWEYNVSLVADTFGVFLIVMLSKWLYEQNSAEANK